MYQNDLLVLAQYMNLSREGESLDVRYFLLLAIPYYYSDNCVDPHNNNRSKHYSSAGNDWYIGDEKKDAMIFAAHTVVCA